MFKEHGCRLYFEKIAVAACSLEKQAIRFQSIDEKPIRVDVAIEGTFPWSDEGMVTKSGFQRSPRNQGKNDFFQFLEILALLFEFFTSRRNWLVSWIALIPPSFQKAALRWHKWLGLCFSWSHPKLARTPRWGWKWEMEAHFSERSACKTIEWHR